MGEVIPNEWRDSYKPLVPPAREILALGLTRGDVIDGGAFGHKRHVEHVQLKRETVVVTFGDGWCVEYPHERMIPLAH